MTGQTEADGIRWLGPVDENGEPRGRGTMIFPDGTAFTGTVDGSDQRGLGRWSYPDGSRMQGGFTLCRENPLFRFISPDGTVQLFSLLYFCPDVPLSGEDDRTIRICRMLKERLAARGQEIEYNARALLTDALMRGADAQSLLRRLPFQPPLLRLPEAVRAVRAFSDLR